MVGQYKEAVGKMKQELGDKWLLVHDEMIREEGGGGGGDSVRLPQI